ncbi:UNVERIFIED_CONTAM: hypothetical protein HDU68_009131 [Siphonaria sp. JEL0065]|nr:hypothetical protein HDU68_009131 [Siphonaria sp. JEL0065]
MTNAKIRPFTMQPFTSEIEDLKRRLSVSLYPTTIEALGSWDSGTDLTELKSIADYWRESFDWERFHARLNRYPSFVISDLNGLSELHFVHLKSQRPDATPILLCHGWPDSFLSFSELIDGLTNPEHENLPAFHVVVPSLPGVAFSSGIPNRGFGCIKIAAAFNKLMLTLGYDKYLAHGGDLGSQIVRTLGTYHTNNCIGCHLNFVVCVPRPFSVYVAHMLLWLVGAPYIPGTEGLSRSFKVFNQDIGYVAQQATKPLTLAAGLTDSPIGLLSWMFEKYHGWTAPEGLSRDDILDQVSLYWITRCIGTSFQFYKEHLANEVLPLGLSYCVAPTACVTFPYELLRPLRSWAVTNYNVVHWSLASRGGHFASMENPEGMVDDIRKAAPVLLASRPSKFLVLGFVPFLRSLYWGVLEWTCLTPISTTMPVGKQGADSLSIVFFILFVSIPAIIFSYLF